MRPSLAIRSVFWLWLFAALAVGRLMLLQQLPPKGVQVVLVALTVVLVSAYRLWPALRTWTDALDLRWIVALHFSRFVGIYFLVLYQRGELPYAFAVPGGIGDIVVAALALGVVFVPFAPATRLRAMSIWNIVGLVDILLVVLTAGRLGATDPASMRALTYLPLSLLPTFLVPLIIATHFVLHLRLRRLMAPAG